MHGLSSIMASRSSFVRPHITRTTLANAAGLHLPVGSMHSRFRKTCPIKFGKRTSIRIVAGIEYLVTCILELLADIGEESTDRSILSTRKLVENLHRDEDIGDLFGKVIIPWGGVVGGILPELMPAKKKKKVQEHHTHGKKARTGKPKTPSTKTLAKKAATPPIPTQVILADPSSQQASNAPQIQSSRPASQVKSQSQTLENVPPLPRIRKSKSEQPVPHPPSPSNVEKRLPSSQYARPPDSPIRPERIPVPFQSTLKAPMVQGKGHPMEELTRETSPIAGHPMQVDVDIQPEPTQVVTPVVVTVDKSKSHPGEASVVVFPTPPKVKKLSKLSRKRPGTHSQKNPSKKLQGSGIHPLVSTEAPIAEASESLPATPLQFPATFSKGVRKKKTTPRAESKKKATSPLQLAGNQPQPFQLGVQDTSGDYTLMENIMRTQAQLRKGSKKPELAATRSQYVTDMVMKLLNENPAEELQF